MMWSLRESHEDTDHRTTGSEALRFEAREGRRRRREILPLTRIRKLVGDVRDRVMERQRGGAKEDRVMNRGAYPLSLLKLEARKRHLSWSA